MSYSPGILFYSRVYFFFQFHMESFGGFFCSRKLILKDSSSKPHSRCTNNKSVYFFFFISVLVMMNFLSGLLHGVIRVPDCVESEMPELLTPIAASNE